MGIKIKIKTMAVCVLAWSKYRNQNVCVSYCSVKPSCLDANNKKGNICRARLTHPGLLPSSTNSEQNTNRSLARQGWSCHSEVLPWFWVREFRMSRLLKSPYGCWLTSRNWPENYPCLRSYRIFQRGIVARAPLHSTLT